MLRSASFCALLGLAMLAAGCQIGTARSDTSQLASAQGGLAAPPALDAAAPATDDDIIIDDSAPRLPLAGGYAPADANDVGANAAQRLVSDELARVERGSQITSMTRELQVVAGVNYRFGVTLNNGHMYRAVVHRPLEGDMRLVSFDRVVALN